MLYLVDEDNTTIDIVEEYNKYIDVIGMVTEDGSFYTPDVLVDPNRFINEMDDPERYALVPLMSYCDIYTICYGDGNCYLVPIKDNVDIDITAGKGVTVLRKDGTLIVPKRGHSPRVGQMSLDDYEECINGDCDKDFQDLLEQIKFWTENDVKNAIINYKRITNEEQEDM